MNSTSFDVVASAVRTMNMEQIIDLSLLVRERHDQLQKQTTRSFRVGDRVSFDDSRRRKTVYGTVTKVNRKTIAVRSDEGVNWKVSSTLLTAE